MSWQQYMKAVVPNGVATGLDIGFSNYSLVFITLSFYVMCKSTTPLYLLTFAILWGIEKPSWSLAGVVTVITCGLLLLVAGETRFNLAGFILVMSAAALAGLRWTITQVLLQGNKTHGATGGPVEVLFHLTPIMGLTLGIISISFERLWTVIPASPYFSTPHHTLITVCILAIGGIIAFSMVWAEFMLIANTSALTFMVVGTFKEIVTVGAAVLFLHEPFTVVNAMGLVVLVAGVLLFNWIKYQKMRQGEIKPVVVEDGRLFERTASGAIKKNDANMQLYPVRQIRIINGSGGGGGGDANDMMGIGGGVGSGNGGINSGEMDGLNEGGIATTTAASNGSSSNGSGVGGGNGIAGDVQMVVSSSSRPPSPHMSDNRLRRVFVLQEDEDGTMALPGSAGVSVTAVLNRQHSI